MIAVELRKMLRSRRTWVTVAVIDLLPVIREAIVSGRSFSRSRRLCESALAALVP